MKSNIIQHMNIFKKLDSSCSNIENYKEDKVLQVSFFVIHPLSVYLLTTKTKFRILETLNLEVSRLSYLKVCMICMIMLVWQNMLSICLSSFKFHLIVKQDIAIASGIFWVFFPNRYTNRSKTNCSLGSVWSKMSTFQMNLVSKKVLPCQLQLKDSRPLLRIQWGVVCKFTSRGIKTARS